MNSDRHAPRDGDIRHHILRDGKVSVTILSLGCITQDWRVPLRGARVPVVLGFADAMDYRHNPGHVGVIAGRVANRISNASFSLDGRRHRLDPNEAPHHLHGGGRGIGTRVWRMEPDGDRAVRLRLRSAHGDQGYPGRVDFTVTITLVGFRLRYDMRVRPDRPTPINMAQHSYYNLMGSGSIRRHRLRLMAQSFTPTGIDMIPTGEVVSLDGQPFDFSAPRTIAEADPMNRGLDLNYVLDGTREAAMLAAPNGMTLRMRTDQPGLQLYTAHHLAPGAASLPGQDHAPFAGLCLEPQGFPDSPNRAQFPSVIVTPDRPYRQVLDVTIAPGEAQ